jgi:hypothetical protein
MYRRQPCCVLCAMPEATYRSCKQSVTLQGILDAFADLDRR